MEQIANGVRAFHQRPMMVFGPPFSLRHSRSPTIRPPPISAEAIEKMESTGIELGNLCGDVIESIFSRIPLKTLVKLKLVCKTWGEFIHFFRLINPPPISSFGLILVPPNTPENQEFHGVFNSSHLEFVIKDDPQLQLIDSCNGLLLYSKTDGNFWSYYVSSPFLDQFIELPPAAHDVLKPAMVSLAFDGPGSSSSKNFIVISFFLKEFNASAGTMKFKIFSSETGQWREQETRVLNFNLRLKKGFESEQCFNPAVYWKSRLYWIWSFCMLLYDVKNNFFELIPLPLLTEYQEIISPSSSHMLSQLLWESDGLLHFSQALLQKIKIFTYNGDDQENQWQFYQVVNLENFPSGTLEFMTNNGRVLKFGTRSKIRPCAFNQDLQLLYLFAPPGRIFSYSFETQEFVQEWSFHEMGANPPSIRKVFPFLFKLVDLSLLSRKNMS